MEWRHSGPHRPKHSECKNPLENFSPRFFGMKTASSPLINFQRAKLSTRSITHLCWCNRRIFWRKNSTGKSPSGFCSCTTFPPTHPALATHKKLAFLASNVLITHPILQIWPLRTTTCFLNWRNNWKLPFFVRHGVHCCRGDLFGRTTFWNFVEWLVEVRATG
jgi:hypothetical protein